MKTEFKLPVSFFLLSAPLLARADTIPETGHVAYAFAGGFAGGLIGALLACWLCNRRRNSQSNTDSPK
ncbi:hypothetical protein [Piscinibacter terrae]|uniref:hypothetical protein n=1 Tax=Piscinibacter terrae TaxID=2496871 RepID=UPI000F5B1DF6|nr:hypothetical protein [Albitalea terrae]